MTVNQRVTGSSPVWGAKTSPKCNVRSPNYFAHYISDFAFWTLDFSFRTSHFTFRLVLLLAFVLVSAVSNQPINHYLETFGLIIDTPILSPSLITVS
jgi:hypothetical protein